MPNYNGHGGNIARVCAAYGLSPSEVIDFSANINPLGYPTGLPEVLRQEFHTVLHYPDVESTSLRQAIAKKIGHEEEEIIIGNGSTELLYLLPRALRPKKGFVFQPTYSDYARALETSGAAVEEIICTEEGLLHSNLRHPFLDKSDWEILFLCNPNNPTGCVVRKEEILALAGRFPDRYLVIDEAFIDFLERPEGHSILAEAGRIRNVILLHSLTKFFGFPGLRLGYMVAHPEVIKKVEEVKEPWTVNALAQVAGLVALMDEAHASRSREFVSSEKSFLHGSLLEMDGISPLPPSVNFILSKIDSHGPTAKGLREALIKRGIIIRDCSNFKGLSSRYFRVAVRRRDENLRLLSALRAALKELRD